MTKKCSKCQEEKSTEAFNKNKTRRDGLQTFCKPCGAASSKAHYTANNKKKAEALGMSPSSATHKLRKILLYESLKQLGKLCCFQCEKEIVSLDEFTVEHKIPWLYSDNPAELYFDLSNVAYSHQKCNSGAARKGPLLGARKYTDDGRQCSACHIWKPFKEFCCNKGKPGGRERMCRNCRRASRRLKKT